MILFKKIHHKPLKIFAVFTTNSFHMEIHHKM